MNIYQLGISGFNSYVLQVDPNLPCSTPKIVFGKQSVN